MKNGEPFQLSVSCSHNPKYLFRTDSFVLYPPRISATSDHV